MNEKELIESIFEELDRKNITVPERQKSVVGEEIKYLISTYIQCTCELISVDGVNQRVFVKDCPFHGAVL